MGSLKAVAAITPDTIFQVPRIGTETGEEILAVTLSEWAMAYLDEGGPTRVEPRSSGGEAAKLKPTPHALAKVFARIERATAFEAYRRRQLDPCPIPTQSEVAVDLGIPSERVAHYERTIRGMLEKQMRDKESPFSAVADYLRDRLGPLSRPHDLSDAIATIDPAERTMPESMPHRRALLLQLAGFRVSAEWVVDVEIEGIIEALLRGLTESGPAELDALARQLARLGVREELRFSWIVGQPGFRVVDGDLVRIDND